MTHFPRAGLSLWQARLQKPLFFTCCCFSCAQLKAILVSSGLMSKHLQKAAVNIIGDQACKKFYPVQISSRMLCAGFQQGTVDSCSVSARAANAVTGIEKAHTKSLDYILSGVPCSPSSAICPSINWLLLLSMSILYTPHAALLHQPVTGQGNTQRGNTKSRRPHGACSMILLYL